MDTLISPTSFSPFPISLFDEMVLTPPVPAPVPVPVPASLPERVTWNSARGAALTLDSTLDSLYPVTAPVSSQKPTLPRPWIADMLRTAVPLLADGMGRALCAEGQALLTQLPDAARSYGELQRLTDRLRFCTVRQALVTPRTSAQQLDLTLLGQLWDTLREMIQQDLIRPATNRTEQTGGRQVLQALIGNPLLMSISTFLFRNADDHAPETGMDSKLARELGLPDADPMLLPLLLNETRPRRFLRRMLPELSLPLETLEAKKILTRVRACRAMLGTDLPHAMIPPLVLHCRITPQHLTDLNALLGAGRTRVLLQRLIQHPSDNDAAVISDTLRLHATLKNMQKAATALERIISRAGDLHRLERSLAGLYEDQKHENMPLDSATNPDYAQLDQQIGELTFRRAADTHELRRVGNVMHHCVGGYAESALSGQRVIVIGYTGPKHATPSHPVACLEIRPGTSTGRAKMNQYKLASNARPKGPALRTARAYLAAANLQDVSSDLS